MSLSKMSYFNKLKNASTSTPGLTLSSGVKPSSSKETASKKPEGLCEKDIDEIWKEALTKSSNKNERYERGQKRNDVVNTGGLSKNEEAVRRMGWKTIRLFISSTFLDFQKERDILVKKVFPDLKAWCHSLHLYLIEIDLRWGVKKGADSKEALKTCLEEIDHCYDDNIFPFFLNMSSERVGWIPSREEVGTELCSKYEWIDGLSITEMEVVHGAIRSKNPNALFLLRHPSFLKGMPEQSKSQYLEPELPIAKYKAAKYRDVINETFHSNQVFSYSATYAPETNSLKGFEDIFKDTVLDFFKERISLQYPLVKDQQSKWEYLAMQHEAFMRSEAATTGGMPVWDEQICQLFEYIEDTNIRVPYIITAKSGSGKTSCVSAFIEKLQQKHPNHQIFYHFTGAVPGSVSYTHMVKRIAMFLHISPELLKNNDKISMLVCAKLATSNAPTLIVADAYNQLMETFISWIPHPLGLGVKVIITAGFESGIHESIARDYLGEPIVHQLIPINYERKTEMVQAYLGQFNKQLDNEQLEALLKKKSSQSYYWLLLACEELRVFGHFGLLLNKIESLSDDLVELQIEILQRFEVDQKRADLLIAALCFLVVSPSGLLEVELLQLLAEPPLILPPKIRESKYSKMLDMNIWIEIIRDIRPFVQPVGDPSEGRLKIYHKTFQNAVEKLYFQEDDFNYKWFHQKLADFFERNDIFERKVEEYPYHLSKIGDTERLNEFLCQWKTIQHFFINFSKQLSVLWSSIDKECHAMGIAYSKLAATIITDNEEALQKIDKSLILATICYQNGLFKDALEIISKIESSCNEINDKPDSNDWEKRVLHARLLHIKAKSFDQMNISKSTIYKASMENTKITLELYTQALGKFEDLQKNKQNEVTVSNNLTSILIKEIKIEELLSMQAELCNRLGMLHIGQVFQRSPGEEPEGEDSSEVLRKKACDWVMKAEELYQQAEDMMGVADIQTSFALCMADDKLKQDHFERAEELLGKNSGGVHIVAGRLYMNRAINLEMKGDNEHACAYYEKYVNNSQQMFGMNHAETQKAVKALKKCQNKLGLSRPIKIE